MLLRAMLLRAILWMASAALLAPELRGDDVLDMLSNMEVSRVNTVAVLNILL
jgi:hypothetical protein